MVGELTKECEIEPGSEQAADRDEAERGEQPPAVAARVRKIVVRAACGQNTPRFQGAVIRVPLLLYTARAPGGLVREHDEGEREEKADQTQDFTRAVAGKARHGVCRARLRPVAIRSGPATCSADREAAVTRLGQPRVGSRILASVM